MLITAADVTPQYFKVGINAKISFPKNWVVKLDNSVDTMVVFNRELDSGVWRFTAGARKLKLQFGIGIVDSKFPDIPHPYD